MLKLRSDKVAGILISLGIFAAFLMISLFNGKYALLIGATVAVTAAAVAIGVINKRSIHSYNNRQVLMITSVAAVLTLTLYYFFGIELGFVISDKGNISLQSFFLNILPIAVIIVATEIVREIVLTVRTKADALIAYAIGVTSELVCAGGIPDIRSSYQLANFLGITVFPALTANIFFIYTSKRYGKAAPIAYRMIFTLYQFLIPAVPDVPMPIFAFVLLVLPIALMSFIRMLFEKKERKARKRESKIGIVFSCIAIVLMLSFVSLITCQFRFGMLVIATESMADNINPGDAVVFESYKHCGEIQEGDVIVFEENNRRVVHRVVEIITVNGQKQYITKGDANDGVDAGYRTDSHIIGVVRFKVLYIGYPSLWLKQIIDSKRGGA